MKFLLLGVVLVAFVAACTPDEVEAWNALHLGGGSDSTERVLACIRHHESDRGPWPHRNGYNAKNRRSSASGAYQFVNKTWRTMSARAGHGGYPTARSAPPAVQDAVARYTVETGGRGHWRGSGC